MRKTIQAKHIPEEVVLGPLDLERPGLLPGHREATLGTGTRTGQLLVQCGNGLLDGSTFGLTHHALAQSSAGFRPSQEPAGGEAKQPGICWRDGDGLVKGLVHSYNHTQEAREGDMSKPASNALVITAGSDGDDPPMDWIMIDTAEEGERPYVDIGWDDLAHELLVAPGTRDDGCLESGPATICVGLGAFLNALGITAEECARAIAEDAADPE